MIPFLKSLTFVTLLLLAVQHTDSIHKCLSNDAEIQAVLTSSTPPFDNYFKISRAIFPSTDVSSLYVRIRVKFVLVNGSESETQLYTWAMSCLYVSTQYIDLFAMNWYSLYAIFPNRRQRELEITMPELCTNMTDHDDSKMLYFLSTLEDIAIRPGAQNPELNTAECVVKGHSCFTSNIFTGVRYYIMMNVCWCVLVVSLVLSFVAAFLFEAWLQTNSQEEHRKKSVQVLFCVMFTFEIIVAIVACTENSSSNYIYSVVFVALTIVVSVVFSIVYRIKNKEKEKCRILKAVVAFSTLNMSFHHLIWILLGVITEPFWALPVLVVACSFCFSIYVLAFYHYKSFDNINWFAVVLSAALMLTLLLFFFTTGVVGQSFLRSNPIAGLLQSALVAITTLWIKYIGSPRDKEKPATENSHSNSQMETGV